MKKRDSIESALLWTDCLGELAAVTDRAIDVQASSIDKSYRCACGFNKNKLTFMATMDNYNRIFVNAAVEGMIDNHGTQLKCQFFILGKTEVDSVERVREILDKIDISLPGLL